MEKIHPPQTQHRTENSLDLSGDKDFITSLQESPPPATVVKSLLHFARALPEDVQQNTASIEIGWNLDMTSNSVTSYLTLVGKNRVNIVGTEKVFNPR